MAWSERSEPAEIYPNGINGAMLQMLSHEKGIMATAANLADPGQGLTEEGLRNTDVLISFGHKHHKVLTDENVDRIIRRVEQDGMGYLPIHSSHYARAFQKIMATLAERRGAPLDGTPGRWGKVRNEGKPELIHVLEPKHPIAKDPFNVPPPDVKIMERPLRRRAAGWQQRPAMEFRKRQRIQAEVQQILKNAIRFLASR